MRAASMNRSTQNHSRGTYPGWHEYSAAEGRQHHAVLPMADYAHSPSIMNVSQADQPENSIG